MVEGGDDVEVVRGVMVEDGDVVRVEAPPASALAAPGARSLASEGGRSRRRCRTPGPSAARSPRTPCCSRRRPSEAPAVPDENSNTKLWEENRVPRHISRRISAAGSYTRRKGSPPEMTAVEGKRRMTAKRSEMTVE
nr:hypothetical protein Iba_chr12fCG19270 [Ipomoea batatas]